MDVKLPFLTVVLLSSPLLTLCDPLYVLSAPNLLRVGSSENVFVEAQDYSGAAVNVKIIVTNLKKNLEILSKSVRLTADNNFQILTEIKIPDDQQYFSDDPLEKQYVYLQAQFPSTTLEKVVMISFQSGYIFVQTDKPIYTPASTEKIFPVKGMKSGEYAIPEIASSGIWKVVTQFTNTPQKTFTADFEVKQYMLPVFEVKLKPSKSFFYVDDQSLTVDIEAKYLFGQKVDGNAFVVFGVMNGEKKIRIPTSRQKVQILKGAGTAELTNQMITETFLNISQLVGRSIWFSVSVLTESGSEMVEAERRGIQIVTSSYTIHFKKTPQFFKPGMPFDVSIYVTNPDQTPAENVEVEINPGGVKGRTRANGIAKATINTLGGSSTLEITAKTKYRQLSDEQQAVKKMTAQAYIPKDGSDNYLHIFSDAAELQIGDQMKVFLNTGHSPGVKDQDYTYMILSKGQILKVDRFKRRGQSLVSLPLPVTKDMVPSFRFVAYYHVGSSEVVSDSVWVDVKDTCMGTVGQPSQNNRDEVKLQITGDPGAKVGLVVVDKAVNVLNKNRLTQTQIWDVIEKHDIGCTAGGGRDSMGVFTDAGLMFQSNTAGGTNTRTSMCPSLIVILYNQRAIVIRNSRLITPHKDYILNLGDDCVVIINNKPISASCSLFLVFLIGGGAAVFSVVDCLTVPMGRTSKMGRDDDKYYTDFEMILSRTNIPENWLWEEIDLPTCRENHCGTTSVTDKVIYLKQSITTRQIVAVSLSPTHGICVAEPEEMVVFKTLFIDLKMPYSAVRGEQLEIKAIIHNYSQKKLKVRVEFMETENVCSSASKKGKYRTIVNVDKDSSIAVSYVIIPMTLGNHIIEVKASAYDSVHTDGVKKPLKVVVRLMGILSLFILFENPLVFKADIPADRLPDTPAKTYISITGKEKDTVEQAINGSFMGRLIVQPSANGESNMIRMTLPLIATHYLDSTNQWETVGMERRNEAIKHINTGYQWQLVYRKSDGSYSIFTQTPSSTWLTAYVAKVFTMASDFIYTEDHVICSALEWLVLHKQIQDGSFKEDSAVIHREMMGDIQGKNADVSLTAFILITMQEGREICAESVASLHESIKKAVSFLEGRLPQLTNPYAVAMTSYAMANENKLKKDILMRHSTQGEAGRFWTVPGQHYHSLEATAYAVLALVKAKDFDKAGEAVHWLARQQAHYGGSGTTQATIMVFQAVAEYHTQVKNRQNFNLDVELSVAGRSKPVRYNIKRDNAHLTHSYKVDINNDFNVTARGTGAATLSVSVHECLYSQQQNIVQNLQDLLIISALDLHFHSYKSDKTDATMTILDIGLPTGFTVDKFICKLWWKISIWSITKFHLNTLLYTLLITFRMHKLYNVGQLQPAAVTIYEYYSPDPRCTKFYHPERTDGALNTLCKGDLCYCAEGIKCFLFCPLGIDEEVEGKVRQFLARPVCREHLGFVKDKSYLIIGKSVDLAPPHRNSEYAYILGEQTWVEYWPTREESQTPEHRERYIGISELQDAKRNIYN
uniref:Complement C3-like n=1 Tax=Sinocyclocheilus grahami TaxID=75366 RepID=A0A672K2X4_SINGR